MKKHLFVLALLVLVACNNETQKPTLQKDSTMQKLPIINDLWDFADPETSEENFREALKYIPEEESEFKAELLTQIARTFSLRGKYDEAHKQLDEVEELLATSGDTLKTRYDLERGRTFNSAGDKEKAKEHFLKAVESGKRTGNDYLTIDAMHMMGIVEEPDKAIRWHLLGLQLIEQTQSANARQWTGALTNNLGWTYHDKGDFDNALKLFEQGLDFRSVESNEPGFRIAKWAVARCKRSLKRYQEALDEQYQIISHYYPGFQISEFDESTSTIDGYVLEEIGECLLALGNKTESKPYFKAAHQLLSKDDWLVENESERLDRLKNLGQ